MHVYPAQSTEDTNDTGTKLFGRRNGVNWQPFQMQKIRKKRSKINEIKCKKMYLKQIKNYLLIPSWIVSERRRQNWKSSYNKLFVHKHTAPNHAGAVDKFKINKNEQKRKNRINTESSIHWSLFDGKVLRFCWWCCCCYWLSVFRFYFLCTFCCIYLFQ